MPTLNLTTEAVRRTKPAEKQTDYWDKNTSGLVMRVNIDGSKTWTVRYRSGGRDSKRYRMKIGTFPEMSLTEARKSARVQIGKSLSGEDPAAEKQHEMKTRLERGKNVAQLVDEFMTRHASVKCEKSTTAAYSSFFTNWVIPAIGNRPIGSSN